MKRPIANLENRRKNGFFRLAIPGAGAFSLADDAEGKEFGLIQACPGYAI
ncbi:MAG: hypothetical protein JW720_06160 [Sedimentisphaerales bacterium]|nr:hypothetical protein [Sedimentisphaerales bacterium]